MEENKLEITKRIDYAAIEEFYDYWEMSWIIDFDQFKEIVACKIIEMADGESDNTAKDETDSDVIYINGKDSHQYDIDIEFERSDGSVWIYPTAYGRRLEDDGECVLLKKDKLRLDDACFKEDRIVNFYDEILIELPNIEPHDVKDKVKDFAEDKFFSFPDDEWHEIWIVGSNNIDAHFIIEQDINTGDMFERIEVYPISYGKTLVNFPYVIYERKVEK